MLEYMLFHVKELYVFVIIFTFFIVSLLYYISPRMELGPSNYVGNRIKKWIYNNVSLSTYNVGRHLHYVIVESITILIFFSIVFLALWVLSKDLYCNISHSFWKKLEDMTVAQDYCTKIYKKINE